MGQKNKKQFAVNIDLTIFASVLCGTGCGFMNVASLGMDAVGSLYDGIRTAFDLSLDSIGTVSMGISIVLIIFLFIVKRKYVSIGTVIYLLVYGISANLSTSLLEKAFNGSPVYLHAVLGVIGILILSFGLGIYIAVDIGVDPFTGIILLITDVTHKKLQYVKIVMDIITMVAGIILGARIGALTVISVLAEGPLIAFFTKQVQLYYFRILYRKRS